MVFFFNGLKAQVTISGTVATGLNTPSSTQTIVQGRASLNLTTSYQTAYTVTGGKTFYLTSIIVTHATNVDGVLFTLSDNGAADLLSFRADATTAAGQASLNFPTPMKYSTTLQIKAGGTANGCLISYVGFEI